MIDKTTFLEGCIAGFNNAKRECPEWLELTKTEKKKLAQEALADFDKIYYGFECVLAAGDHHRLINAHQE